MFLKYGCTWVERCSPNSPVQSSMCKTALRYMQPSGCTPLLKTGGGNTKRQFSSRKRRSFGRYPLDFFTNFPYSWAPASARHYQNSTRVSLFGSAEVHKSALSASREAMKMFATLKLHPNSTSSVGECFHSSYTKVGGVEEARPTRHGEAWSREVR